MPNRVFALLIAACVFCCGLTAQTVWTGATSNQWNVATNWSTTLVPTAVDDVVIPAVAVTQPTLTAGSLCNNLTLDAGATLTGGAGSIVVSGNFICNGAYVAGTASINMGGTSSTNVTFGGTTSPITVYSLWVNKPARTVFVTLLSDIVCTNVVAGTGVNTCGLEVQLGTLDTGGRNVTVNGRLNGGAQGEFKSTIGGTILLNTIYQWNLAFLTFNAGTVTISGLHEIANSGHRCDVNGATVTYTLTGTNVTMFTNNPGWGYFCTAGQVIYNGSLLTSSTCHTTFSGTGVARFVGALNTTITLNGSASTNTWIFPDLRIEKTGGATVSFSNTTVLSNNLTVTSLTVNAGAGVIFGGIFGANFGPRITTVNNSGAITWINGDIQVSGNITTNAGGSMTANTGSTVALTGAAASTLTGNNTFYNLSCTVAGRQINFASGSTTTVNGLLLLTGSAASTIVLRSTSTGVAWNLNDAGGEYVRYVDVRDSNATNSVVDAPGGVDAGNNVNWSFGGGLAVLATVGTAKPVNANETGNGAGAESGKFAIDNASPGSINVTGISIKAGGTGSDDTAYTQVALYLDSAAGTVGAYDVADTLWGTAAVAFPANDGTLVFTDTVAVAPATSRTFFVVTKLDGAVKPAAGQTFQFQVSAFASSAGSIAGTPSSFMAGLLITAPVLNRFFPTNPANTAIQVPANYTGPGGNGFVLNVLGLQNPGSAPVNATTITISHSGSGIVTPAASTAYTRFELYKDTNGNEVWDPTDVKIGVNTPVLPAIFVVQAAEQLHAGLTTTLYFIVGGFNSPSVPINGATFNFSTSFTVTSAYPGATTGGTNFVRNGATINTTTTLGLLVTRAASSPVATATQTDTGPGGNGLEVGKFAVDNLSATTPGSLTSFTVTLNSSAATFIPRSYTELKFFQDTNNSGVWDAGDAQVGATVLGTALGTTAVTTAIVPTFTAAAPINFPASSSTAFFLVAKFNGTPLPTAGITYRSFISGVGVGVSTTSSGLATGNAAGAFIVPNQLAVLATAGTAQNFYSNAQGPGGLGIEAGKFEITANNSPGSSLLSISIAASGTGNDTAAFSEVALYRDGAAGAIGSYDNASDTLIGTFAAFPADDGTLVFTVPAAEQSFAASEARTYFVVVRLANIAVPGETLQFRVSDIGVNLGKSGVPSAVMAGLTIQAPVFTFADTSPVQATAFAGQGGFVIQQFTLSYPAGPDNTLTSITFTGMSAAGNVQTDVTPAELYRDANANGVYDAGTDVLVNSQPNFNGANQVVFALAGAESQFSAAAALKQYFVVVGFTAATPNLSIFQTQLNTAGGASAGTAINGTPAPAGGPAPGLEVLANNLLLTLNGPAAALTVANTSQGIGGIGEVLWDGTLATISGAWTVTDITFTATGTANQTTAYSYVALFEDSNTNGVYDGTVGGDTLADPAPAGGFSGANAYTATLANGAFPATTARRFFLVVKLSGTATTGQTLNAELTSLNGTPPVGGQLSGDVGVSSTALIIDLPAVTATGATGGPADFTLKAGSAQLAVVGKIHLAATNNNVAISGITFTTGGTGNWTTDFNATSGVQVWLDDGDGIFNAASDTSLFAGAGAFTVNALFSANVTVPNNSTADLWLRVETQATAVVGQSVPFTYTIGIAGPGDISTVGGAAPVLGAPAPQSATLKIVDFFVTDFTPVTDLLVGGAAFTITGSGFEAPFVLRIGGVVCPGVAVITPTQVTGLTVPAGSGINQPIQVDSGTLATQTLTQTFTYVTVTKPKKGNDGCVAGLSAPLSGLLPLMLGAAVIIRRRRK